ncbi:MAG TPA: GWxTD domain-containing protein [Acidobacteriota bacterium]|nr:GWxTD domain-containing protein [Acidobacteriota bacterium]
MSGRLLRAALCILCGWVLLSLWTYGEPASGQEKQEKERRQEEQEDYYQKWLREDVTYIITQAERDVFEKLVTDEERDQFIEQFWRRRDPDMRTPNNEFKEEHYRRVAYANERFASGVPGWKTDRGRIYIIHGEPVEIEKHYSGESYQRPSHEGGGFTSVVPFEIWRYHYIEGLGPDVEIEFVDPTRTREFRLARNPWEKDELLVVPGAGPTIAESLGLMERGDHPYFTYTNRDQYPGMSYRAEDNPFTRYEKLVTLQSPKEIKYNDLKALVVSDTYYDNLPVTTRHDYFQLNPRRTLAVVSLEIDNRNLSFNLENGAYVARVALYGIVTSITNEVLTEFDHELITSYSPDEIERGRNSRSIYQKVIPVDSRIRHRIDLVVKDLVGNNVGVSRKAILPPGSTEGLATSSMILSDHIVPLGEIPQEDEMFVIGDVKVRPNLSGVFQVENPLGVYLHVYNAAVDQASGQPHLNVEYQLLKDGEVVFSESDEGGQSVYYFSSSRVVLIKGLSVSDLEPGSYQLKVRVEDEVRQKELAVTESLRLEKSGQATD